MTDYEKERCLLWILVCLWESLPEAGEEFRNFHLGIFSPSYFSELMTSKWPSFTGREQGFIRELIQTMYNFPWMSPLNSLNKLFHFLDMEVSKNSYPYHMLCDYALEKKFSEFSPRYISSWAMRKAKSEI